MGLADKIRENHELAATTLMAVVSSVALQRRCRSVFLLWLRRSHYRNPCPSPLYADKI